jgi:hypothetical protein
MTSRFQRRCVGAGIVAIIAGLGIDVALWVDLIGDERGPAVAALAQSLILVGITLFMFGLITQLIASRPGAPVTMLTQDRPAPVDASASLTAADS